MVQQIYKLVYGTVYQILATTLKRTCWRHKYQCDHTPYSIHSLDARFRRPIN